MPERSDARWNAVGRWTPTALAAVLLALSGPGCGQNGDATTGTGTVVPVGLVPDADAPPVTAPAGTPLHHAQTCAQFLGPIPAVSCMDAEVMPITVDGVPVTETPPWCDRPSALTGTCETGERISARYEGTHHDGSPRPVVVFVNFCRDGGQGLIGHNSENGATCFFHMSQRFPNTVRHPGSNDPDYDAYWQSAAVVAADNCQGCHQADPWLHSPWIDQLRDPNDPSQPLVPVIEGPNAPYIVVGEGFSQPVHEGAPQNSCTSCHRAQCDNGFAEPLGQLVMPGPFAESLFHPVVSDDLQAVRDWCATLPNGGVGGPEVDSICDPFMGCFEGCTDVACATSCATTHLKGAPLSTTQALLTCVEAAGCGLDDEGCIFGSCPAEADAFFEACGN